VVFIVLFDLDFLDLSADFIEGLALEERLIEFFIVGLDEQHVLLEHTDVLEAT
jgi:hypothetical protein